jgi:hypothetical protein
LTFYGNSCTPRALSRLFREPYEASCGRIQAAGGDYQRVMSDVMQRVLEPYGIKRVLNFVRRPRVFNRWRPARGLWVLVVTGWGASTGHCITLRDGRAMDNGWIAQSSTLASLRVHAAWQISRV